MSIIDAIHHTIADTQHTHSTIGYGGHTHPSRTHLTITTTIGHTIRVTTNNPAATYAVDITHHCDDNTSSYTTLAADDPSTLARLAAHHIDGILTHLAHTSGEDWHNLVTHAHTITLPDLLDALVDTFSGDDLDKLARTTLTLTEVTA